MLKLQISRESKKFLDSLPPKQFRQVVQKILSLLDDPKPHDCKELKGYPFLRSDVGEYRIVYDGHEHETLRVLIVGKRNDRKLVR